MKPSGMLEDLIRERLKKLEQYKKFGNPYPAKVRRTIVSSEFLSAFSKLEKSKKKVVVVGRITAVRDQGRVVFYDIEDGFAKVQLVFNAKVVKDFAIIKEAIDTGDFLEAAGSAFKTKKGEKSVLVKSARLLTKSVRPLPAKWYGLEDVEARLRERYLDILFHKEVKEMFVKKSIFWETVRHELKAAGFLEVENPVFENIPGGAEAEPFVTHHNALDTDFYLRISLELPLKKLLVAGYEKVFEIGRVFRNEGVSREHLQDYTQMECYWSYADYEDMMRFVEQLYKTVIKKVFGTLKLENNKKIISWDKKWERVDYYKIFEKEAGLDLYTATEIELRKKAKELLLAVPAYAGRGRLIDLIYKKAVRTKLIQPCFLIDPPVEIEPLAKRLERDPGRVARFQVVAAHTELGKGFSELNDPSDQRQRFEDQMKLREKGDREAQSLDEDFVEALEYGMPPAAGFGLSERLFAVLMDKPVRETVIFPLMKPKK